jgi:pimeloyl-ACP methyl ester carboxylesterase
MILLTHARASIALHELAPGPGPTLLCLHGMGGSAADFQGVAWPGRVLAIDFVGHGASHRLRSGAYFPEVIALDADAALAHAGGAHLLGVGSGAYVALLIAGARPDHVPAALLEEGPGLEGGGELPDWTGSRDGYQYWHDFEPPLRGCDPAVRRLERDVRPREYGRDFALGARRILLCEDGRARPPWWQAVRDTQIATAAPADRAAALAQLLAASH